MAASPSQSRAMKTAGGPPVPVPVARPPELPKPGLTPVDPEPPLEWDWWTPEAIRGWAGSVVLHIVLLLILAFWYFSPPLHKAVIFDSRLAGSSNGVPEGEMFSGGSILRCRCRLLRFPITSSRPIRRDWTSSSSHRSSPN